MTREIDLSQGRVALVDDDDYEGLAQHRWYLSTSGKRGRPVRTVRTTTGYTELPMVRAILPHLRKGQPVRYRNGDPCDLRRENILAAAPTIVAPSPLARGTVGELMVAADLARHGFEVFLPVHGYSKWDLIAVDAHGRCHRVQVKSGVSKGDVLTVSIQSASYTASGVRVRPLPIDKLDLLACFDSRTGRIAYLGPTNLRPQTHLAVSLTSEAAGRRGVARGSDQPDVVLSRNSPELFTKIA